MPGTSAVSYPRAAPAPPSNWSGSAPEWMVYWAFTQIGYQPGRDFQYQSAQDGGRLTYGGNVLDFFVPDQNLAINVQSTYYHYAQVSTIVHDRFVQSSILRAGMSIIYIDEEDARKDPIFYVKEAIAGKDYSRMTGRNV